MKLLSASCTQNRRINVVIEGRDSLYLSLYSTLGMKLQSSLLGRENSWRGVGGVSN